MPSRETNPEQRIALMIQNSLIEVETSEVYPINRAALDVNRQANPGEPHAIDYSQYERLAVFGSYLIDSTVQSQKMKLHSKVIPKKSNIINIISAMNLVETRDVPDESLPAIINTAQRGLFTVQDIAPIPRDLSEKIDKAGLTAGGVAKEKISHYGRLLAGIEVYEHVEDKSLEAGLVFSASLEDTVFGVREYLLRRNVKNGSCGKKKRETIGPILNPPIELQMGFAVQAAIDLMPEDIDAYPRVS